MRRINYKPEKFPSGDSEDALFWIKIHVVSAKIGEGFSQISNEVTLLLRLDHNVIHVGMNIAAYLIVQTILDAPLISRAIVLQAERH